MYAPLIARKTTDSTRVRARTPAGIANTKAGERAGPPAAAGMWDFAKIPVDDPLEREAERVTDDVMRMPSPQFAGRPRPMSRDVPTRTRANAADETPLPAIVSETLRSPGQPLDSAARAFAEPRFGRDFSGVRTHTDARAAASARSLRASAYTVGSHVVFAEGRYAPGTNSGRQLLAHELTHTLQQHGDGDARCAFAGAFVQRQTKDAPAKPAWTRDDIKAIQVQLARLGLYSLTIDGVLGDGSKSGLVEAFGSDAWQTLDAAAALAQLKAAKPPTGKAGEHRFRWGEMFKDGLLDMVLAVGFDEAGNNSQAYKNFVQELTDHKFAKNSVLAAALFKAAGRTLGPSAFGDYYVKEKAISYTPPAGPPRAINAVVRLVTSDDGSKGAQVADAFKEGMVTSDIAYYSGHGRYGSGPDFDRNFTFDLLDAKGAVERTIADYDVLEKTMKKEGAIASRDAWAQFMWRVNNKRIDVHASNAGNVVLNTENPHPGDFGSNLMYWNMNRAKGGSAAVTGAAGSLAASAAAAPEHAYHLLVFDGCRSVDYVKSLRGTPGFNSKQADVLGSQRLLDWGDEGRTLAKFLDGILQMQSAEQIVTEMDKQQSKGTGAYHGYGIGDNPVIK